MISTLEVKKQISEIYKPVRLPDESGLLKISIVIPSGDSVEAQRRTIASVGSVAAKLPMLRIVAYLGLNNGQTSTEGVELAGKADLKIRDINPVASRAAARNIILDEISEGEDSYVVFLDSGDLLVPDALEEIIKTSATKQYQFINCQSNVQSENKRFLRSNKSAKLMGLVNPFYLGSVVISRDIIGECRFQEGSKEDWKFWTEVVTGNNINFLSVEKPNYTYTIKSRLNHAGRKSRLIVDQYEFFRSYLGDNKLKASFKILMHYTFLIYFWVAAKKI